MKTILIVVALVFLFGLVFNFLFKVGLIVLIVLGISYLVKKIIA